MLPFDQLTKQGQVSRFREAAIRALEYYDLEPKNVVFVSFNFPTFRVDAYSHHEVEHYVLRIGHDYGLLGPSFFPTSFPPTKPIYWPMHRTDLRMQMFWLDSLSTETNLTLQRVVPNRDGQLVTDIEVEGLPGLQRCAVCYWLPGSVCDAKDFDATKMRLVGQTMAQLHNHAEHFTLPAPFTRPSSGWQGFMSEAIELVGKNRVALGLSKSNMMLIYRLMEVVFDLMEEIGLEARGFGLIHNDLCPQNIIFQHEQASPIDFGNAVFGYYLWDMAPLFSALDYTEAEFFVRHRAFVEGYKSVRELPDNYLFKTSLFLALYEIRWLFYALNYEWAHKNRVSYIFDSSRLLLDGNPFLAL